MFKIYILIIISEYFGKTPLKKDNSNGEDSNP